MKPLHLWHRIAFLPEGLASILRNHQRAAHRSPPKDTASNEPMTKRGLSGHALFGLQPPWPLSPNRVYTLVPEPFQRVALRVLHETELGSMKALERAYARRPQLHGFDAYVVWAGKVQGHNLNSENLEYRRAMAELEMLYQTMDGGVERAEQIMDRLVEAVEINFNPDGSYKD